MEKLLYYPYINMPRSEWTLRSLLYYEQVGTIVPPNFDLNNYDKFMQDLVNNNLVLPINPIETLENPFQIAQPFIEYINTKEFNLKKRRVNFADERYGKIHENKFNLRGPKIHVEKFDGEIFYQLEQAGIAKREDNNWFIVEEKTANELMSFLASIIGGKLNFLPTTDLKVKKVPFSNSSKKVYKTIRKEKIRREIILKEIIPFPEQIDLMQLRKFKDKYPDLLNKFKNKVELIALNHNLEEDSQLFKETMKELIYDKQELSAKMNESRLGQIMFGTVCGITGAIISLVTAEPSLSLGGTLLAVPAFTNAIHYKISLPPTFRQ
ncbi:kinase [Kaistella carnis]|uniref:kinase n=1 Tax=Kaistella carnis TaxID=1241979 RepID=UPI0028AB75FA|nr:kinase [Kaistella carnis]